MREDHFNRVDPERDAGFWLAVMLAAAFAAGLLVGAVAVSLAHAVTP